MPWTIQRTTTCPIDRPYGVVGPDGAVEGCHASREEAHAQQSALYASEAQKGIGFVPESIKATAWREELHPRNHGRFASKPGAGASSTRGGADHAHASDAKPPSLAEVQQMHREAERHGRADQSRANVRRRQRALGGEHALNATIDDLAEGRPTTVDVSNLPALKAQIQKRKREFSGGLNMSNLHVSSADHGNLFDFHATDLPREAMPVIPDKHADVQGFAAHLDSLGIGAHEEMGVDPTNLHATQNQLEAVKVAGIADWASSDPEAFAQHWLVATRDGDILDGHHRWAGAAIAALDPPPNVRVNVLVVDTDIKTLLEAGWEFDKQAGITAKPFGAKAKMSKLGEEPPGPPPDPDKPYLWFNGKWILLATDSQDGVPRKLDMAPTRKVNTKLNSEPNASSKPGSKGLEDEEDYGDEGESPPRPF